MISVMEDATVQEGESASSSAREVVAPRDDELSPLEKLDAIFKKTLEQVNHLHENRDFNQTGSLRIGNDRSPRPAGFEDIDQTGSVRAEGSHCSPKPTDDRQGISFESQLQNLKNGLPLDMNSDKQFDVGEPQDGQEETDAPICPEIVSPSSESCFSVSFSRLQGLQENDSVEIKASTGSSHLRLTIHGGVRVDISIAGGTQPKCSIACPDTDSEDQVFKILADGNQLWGYLRTLPNNVFDIFRRGRTILAVENFNSFRFAALDVNDEVCAMSGVKGDQFEVRVAHGNDAALILAAIFAIVLFVEP